MEKLQQNPAEISNVGKHNHASINTSKVTVRLTNISSKNDLIK